MMPIDIHTDPERLMQVIERLGAKADRLKSALESIGQDANICVADDIGRRCSYCMCGADKQGKRP